MNIKALTNRVAKVARAIEPPPLIIDCTGARDELIAHLRSHMSPDELYRVDNGLVEIDEETQRKFDEFSEFLEWKVKQTEQEYNVRFVSYEQH